MTWEPVPGSHVYGSRLAECRECASTHEHELRDAWVDIERLEKGRAEDAERIKLLEARLREEEGNSASTLVKLHIVTRERDAALEKVKALEKRVQELNGKLLLLDKYVTALEMGCDE